MEGHRRPHVTAEQRLSPIVKPRLNLVAGHISPDLQSTGISPLWDPSPTSRQSDPIKFETKVSLNRRQCGDSASTTAEPKTPSTSYYTPRCPVPTSSATSPCHLRAGPGASRPRNPPHLAEEKTLVTSWRKKE